MEKITLLILFFSLTANAQTSYLDISNLQSLEHSYSEAHGDNDLVESGFQNYRCFNAIVQGDQVQVQELTHSEATITILKDTNSPLALRFENSNKVFELTPVSPHEMRSEISERQFRIKILENDILLMRIKYGDKLMSILECTKSLLF